MMAAIGEWRAAAAVLVLSGALAVPCSAKELRVERELRIEQEAPLAFGRILGDSGRKVRVTIPADDDDPQPNRWSMDGGLSHRARFLEEGAPGLRFVISLPGAVEGDGWRLRDFTSRPDGLGELDQHGRAVVEVGATLVLEPGARGPVRARFRIGVEPVFARKRRDS